MKTLITTLLTSLCILATPLTAAQPYPAKPITLILPQIAGGVSDVIMRRVAQKMSDILGQSIVIDNRPGAGGNIGTALAVAAPADGYTVLMNSIKGLIPSAISPRSG